MVSPTAATFYFYKSFWSLLRSQALETLCWTCWTWPGPAPKIPKTFFSATFSGTRWTWPGSAPKPPKPSPEPSPETCWTWLGSAPKPPRPSPEPSWNPVEPDLVLHQSLSDLLRNSGALLNLTALHQSLPHLLRNLRNLRNLVELDPAPAPVHTGAILGWRPRCWGKEYLLYIYI